MAKEEKVSGLDATLGRVAARQTSHVGIRPVSGELAASFKVAGSSGVWGTGLPWEPGPDSTSFGVMSGAGKAKRRGA